MSRSWMLTAALLTGTALLAGPALLAGAPARAESAAKPASPAAKPKRKLQPISKAADFALKRSADGQVMKLADFKGKVLLVNFWATWCPPCREEIPSFIDLKKRHGAKGFEIVGISVDRGGPPVVNAFVKDHGINYVSLMSEPAVEAAYGGIRSIPTTFIVDREGNVVKKFMGARPADELEADITSLL